MWDMAPIEHRVQLLRRKECNRVKFWVKKLQKVHGSLGEDLVFVQMKWKEDFEEKLGKLVEEHEELGRRIGAKERELGM